MTPRKIERFMSILAAELATPARAFVTGAAAAALWGRVRPSYDIDLGLELKRGARTGWQAVERAVEKATERTGIAASVAEDIDRWGMITLLDYKRTSRRYAVYGQLEVRLLDPANWSIGKLTRNLDSDLGDVQEVFRRQRVQAAKVASIWGRALRASPASTAQSQFRRNVERFLRDRGRRIWGRNFDVEATIAAFERAARIRRPRPLTT
jgi:hypothetical protein